MQALANTRPCCVCSQKLASPSHCGDTSLSPHTSSIAWGSSQAAAVFRPFQSQHPKTNCRRTRRLRAVSESTPALKKPEIASKPQLKEPPTASPTSKTAESDEAESSSNQVTIQFQREQAKAMRKYFKSLAYSEEVVKSQVFGWTPKNEILNGRWVMFGFAVGLLTEYATGVDFIQQLKLMVSYLGIADIYD